MSVALASGQVDVQGLGRAVVSEECTPAVAAVATEGESGVALVGDVVASVEGDGEAQAAVFEVRPPVAAVAGAATRRTLLAC
mmetsp:Transcript_22819/g.52190  ORF Transcript_22819/g.52190 Transcript_22819/m.52190 type:complete len:82 (-) Transcript_22819:698-943(-)